MLPCDQLGRLMRADSMIPSLQTCATENVRDQKWKAYKDQSYIALTWHIIAETFLIEVYTPL
jgi:hypothetical protein